LPAEEINFALHQTTGVTTAWFGEQLAGAKRQSWSPYTCDPTVGKPHIVCGIIGDVFAESCATVDLAGNVRWYPKQTIGTWQNVGGVCPTNGQLYDIAGSATSAVGPVKVAIGGTWSSVGTTIAQPSSAYAWTATVVLQSADVYRQVLALGDVTSGTITTWSRDSSAVSEPASFSNTSGATVAVAGVRSSCYAYLTNADVPGANRVRYLRQLTGGAWIRSDTGGADFVLPANCAFDASDNPMLVAWQQGVTKASSVYLYTHTKDANGAIGNLSLKSTLDVSAIMQTFGYAAGSVTLGACIRSANSGEGTDKYLLHTALAPNGDVVNMLHYIDQGTGQVSSSSDYATAVHVGNTPSSARSFAGLAYSGFAMAPYVVALGLSNDQRVVYVC
jgi:hypothetical protein